MNPLKAPFGVVGFLGLLAVLPPWIWFIQNRTGTMQPEVRVLVALTLPVIGLLFLVGWLEPRGAG